MTSGCILSGHQIVVLPENIRTVSCPPNDPIHPNAGILRRIALSGIETFYGKSSNWQNLSYMV